MNKYLCFMCLLWLKMNDAALEGASGGLRAIGHTEFPEDVVDVALDRGFADAQRARDLLVRLTLHDFLKHLELSIRELRGVHPFRESFSNHWWQTTCARVDLPDGVLELFEKHVFQQVALRAGLQRTVDIFVAIVSGKNDNARVGKFTANLRDCLHAAQHRHTKIHQGYVGLMLAI